MDITFKRKILFANMDRDMKLIKEVSSVKGYELANGNFLICRTNTSGFANPYFGGNDSWVARPKEISKDAFEREFNRAVISNRMAIFVSTSIEYMRHDVKEGNTSVFYGVILKNGLGRYLAGAKFNHIKWKKNTNVISICNEDDTLIENIVIEV